MLRPAWRWAARSQAHACSSSGEGGAAVGGHASCAGSWKAMMPPGRTCAATARSVAAGSWLCTNTHRPTAASKSFSSAMSLMSPAMKVTFAVLVDALGNPLRFRFTSGATGDNQQAKLSLHGIEKDSPVARTRSPAVRRTSGAVSTPITVPCWPTRSARSRETSPAPLPMSSTFIPGPMPACARKCRVVGLKSLPCRKRRCVSLSECPKA